MRGWERIDPGQVPLPHGTKVTLRVERLLGERRIPQGAVGQVQGTAGNEVLVRLPDGTELRCPRSEVVPTKLGQMRYAVRRAEAWEALVPCVVVETVVGSRAWGLADAQSDTDRRGVFVAPFGWTIGLDPAPRELVSDDGSDTYWELTRAVELGLRADPNTLEMLFLPGADARDEMGQWLLEAREAFVSQAIYGSFGRYALSQLQRLRQSKRLAEHRQAIVGWVRDDPATTLDAVAQRLAREADVEGPTDAERVRRAKRFIKQLYASLYDQGRLPRRDFAAFVAFAKAEEVDDELPRRLRPKNAYNLLRLIATATGWLARGSPSFVVDEPLRAELWAIKRGEVELDEVVARAEAMMPALEEARRTTPLPVAADVTRADAVLRRIREEAARRHVAQVLGPFGADAPPKPPASGDA